MFANFKPGTLAALGFSYEELRALNPRIVLAESSAFGATGPWSDRMGYGPLVRATTGVSRLWTSGEPADSGFYDATTIFPDHVVAQDHRHRRVGGLINRDATGVGAHVHISQAEAAVNQLATTYVTEAARANGLTVADDDAVHAVCPCAGDDEWCVISVRSEEDRVALAKVMGTPNCQGNAGSSRRYRCGRPAATRARSSPAIQDAGVPAGPMNRAVDVLADPQVTFRRLYADMSTRCSTRPSPPRRIPRPTATSPMRPAARPHAGRAHPADRREHGWV